MHTPSLDDSAALHISRLDTDDGDLNINMTATPEIWRGILDILKSYAAFGQELRSYTAISPQQAQYCTALLQTLIDHDRRSLIIPASDFNALSALVCAYQDFDLGHDRPSPALSPETYAHLATQCEQAARDVRHNAQGRQT
ncbi:MAG: hypothetical protein CMH27_10125 [Micavibrio sp.]|nr:hypothetical protein [Micavibrio sp.]|tara:strand:+ start:595 stop:1017 length:423 start_codon:yes stop_codon:yes gene_type:complete